MAERIVIAGYYGMGEPMATSAAERTQIYRMLAEEKPGWAHLMQKMLEFKAPPAVAEPRRAAAYNEIDSIATIQPDGAPPGIGEVSKLRKKAVYFFPTRRMKGAKPNLRTSPSYSRSCAKLRGRFWTQLANELRKLGRIDNAETRPKPASLARASSVCICCVTAGEIAGARGDVGGLGAMSANLAHLIDLSVIRKKETVPHFAEAWSTAWAHVVRERGDLHLNKGELLKVHRGQSQQCIGPARRVCGASEKPK